MGRKENRNGDGQHCESLHVILQKRCSHLVSRKRDWVVSRVKTGVRALRWNRTRGSALAKLARGGVNQPLGVDSQTWRSLRDRRSSKDSGPEPTISRNVSPSNMQKSVRASCIAAQNPDFASIGIFVVAIATRMSISSGIAATRVTRPIISSDPHTTSTTPTNGPKN